MLIRKATQTFLPPHKLSRFCFHLMFAALASSSDSEGEQVQQQNDTWTVKVYTVMKIEKIPARRCFQVQLEQRDDFSTLRDKVGELLNKKPDGILFYTSRERAFKGQHKNVRLTNIVKETLGKQGTCFCTWTNLAALDFNGYFNLGLRFIKVAEPHHGKFYQFPVHKDATFGELEAMLRGRFPVCNDENHVFFHSSKKKALKRGTTVSYQSSWRVITALPYRTVFCVVQSKNPQSSVEEAAFLAQLKAEHDEYMETYYDGFFGDEEDEEGSDGLCDDDDEDWMVPLRSTLHHPHADRQSPTDVNTTIKLHPTMTLDELRELISSETGYPLENMVIYLDDDGDFSDTESHEDRVLYLNEVEGTVSDFDFAGKVIYVCFV